MEQYSVIYKVHNLYRYNKNVIIHIYPKCKRKDKNVLEKKHYSTNFIKNFKKCLSKYDKIETKQCEYYFRDLVMIKTDDTITYYKKRTIYISHKDDIIVGTILDDINEEQFPVLSSYDIEYKNTLEIYKDTMISIIITNDKYICIAINKRPENNDAKKLLIQQLDEILGML